MLTPPEQDLVHANHLEQLVHYISQVFKPCILQDDWADAQFLPLYLQTNWTYKRLSLDGQTCLLMWDNLGEQQTTAQKLKKAITTVAEQFAGPVIYGVSNLVFYNRKRLIDQGIAFVVPGKQLYLPFAALDLRESFTPNRQSTKATLSACAQQLVLLKCSGRWQPNLSAQARADQLGVSKMTISRAYKELIELGLAQIDGSNRLGKLAFRAEGYERLQTTPGYLTSQVRHKINIDTRDEYQLWQIAQGYLASPVRQQIRISAQAYHRHQDVFSYDAGEWALAQQGMLATPKQRCVAVVWADWSGIKKLTGIRELEHQETESVQVQLWRYKPGFMQREELNMEQANSPAAVDTLSLYLSLRNETDERIQLALDDLLSQFWNNYSEIEQ